jgi:4'-phosphopantetheinyl transferase
MQGRPTSSPLDACAGSRSRAGTGPAHGRPAVRDGTAFRHAVCCGTMPGMPGRTPDVVLVSWLDPRELPEGADRVLALDERRRVATSIDASDAGRRTAAGVLLRCVVARVLGRRPQDVTVSRRCPHCASPHGRPELPGTPLQVSVSHAGDRVGVAVSVSAPVGLDVEAARLRPLTRALLRRALTATEQEHVLGTPEDRRAREFLRAWTAKEAILKTTGEGLHGGLPRLDLDLLARPVRLRSWAGSTARACAVRLVELDPGGDHVAALATVGARTVTVTHREGRTFVERMMP